MDTYVCRDFVLDLVAFVIVAAALVWVWATYHANSYVAQ